MAVTDRAELATRSAERHVAEVAAYRAVIEKQYQDELTAIDRLKNQRASWRRDRELRHRMSDSLETANLLSAATRQLDRATSTAVQTRRAYLAAIDAELVADGAASRRLELQRARAALLPEVNGAPRHIVIPDLEVDILADPEELDQRVAELRASEDELTRQLAELDQQAAALEHVNQLRKAHERAGDMFNRDDDQPHRTPVHRTDTVAPEDPTDPARAPSAPASSPTPLDNYVPIVLADVIDATTIRSFAAAERSGDPAKRAAAAHETRAAVARRRDEVRHKRAELEARAKQLRAKG